MTLHGDRKREYQRDWVSARRAKWISDKTCATCGSSEDLQIDHVDPGQKVAHTIWSWSWKRIEAELAKCQVLCLACHRDKTNRDFGWGEYAACGSNSKYNWGCRCSSCREAHAAASRLYRKTGRYTQAS